MEGRKVASLHLRLFWNHEAMATAHLILHQRTPGGRRRRIHRSRAAKPLRRRMAFVEVSAGCNELAVRRLESQCASERPPRLFDEHVLTTAPFDLCRPRIYQTRHGGGRRDSRPPNANNTLRGLGEVDGHVYGVPLCILPTDIRSAL